MTADVAHRLDDVARVDIARDDLRQERREHEIVLIVYEQDFVIGLGMEEMLEIYGGLQTAETCAEDYRALHCGSIVFDVAGGVEDARS